MIIRVMILGVPAVAQQATDQEWPQLRLRFDPWPRNFHMLQVRPKKKKKKKMILVLDWRIDIQT